MTPCWWPRGGEEQLDGAHELSKNAGWVDLPAVGKANDQDQSYLDSEDIRVLSEHQGLWEEWAWIWTSLEHEHRGHKDPS